VLDNLLKSNIAIVGGGNFCKKLLQLLFSEPFEDYHPTILGVADVDTQAEGRVLAKQMGIFTTTEYRELYALKDLQLIMELTADVEFGGIIRSCNGPDRLECPAGGSRKEKRVKRIAPQQFQSNAN
jgi:hypothetical protein